MLLFLFTAARGNGANLYRSHKKAGQDVEKGRDLKPCGPNQKHRDYYRSSLTGRAGPKRS